MRLKYDVIPRGLVPLEELFDFNDVAQKPKIQPMVAEVEDCNIGTKDNPKIVKLSKSLLPEEKQKYIDLLKEYFDAFAWGYEDLNAYDANIIQHTIRIKEDHKTFKQKLRRVNHIL